MYNFLIKNGQRLALGLGVLVIAIFLINIYTGFSGGPYDASTDLAKLTDEELAGVSYFNFGIGGAIAMIIVAFALAFVVFGVADLVKFPKNAVKFGLGFLGLLLIFFILYKTSSVEQSEAMRALHQEFDISDNASKFISGGIKTTLGLLGFSIVSVVAMELWNSFK